jgi:hypothetical protein
MRLEPASDSGEGVKWQDEMQRQMHNGFGGVPGN